MNVQTLDPAITLAEHAHQIIQQTVKKIMAQEVAVLKDKDPEPWQAVFGVYFGH
ncbi:hypothetical protein [Pantanalinema sp. GBBB05]|uniref:hypothetical protein n=1 Tax=Pantanalinema sp. GBBB05 TaxID=2604139 RepID=UPI003D81C466